MTSSIDLRQIKFFQLTTHELFKNVFALKQKAKNSNLEMIKDNECVGNKSNDCKRGDFTSKGALPGGDSDLMTQNK